MYCGAYFTVPGGAPADEDTASRALDLQEGLGETESVPSRQYFPQLSANASREDVANPALRDGDERRLVDAILQRKEVVHTTAQQVRLITGLAIQGERAVVRLMSTGDHLDERALSSTVFAEQRVNFPRPQIERYPSERAYGAEGFTNVG